jgi:alpha-mannosidase
MAKPLYYTFGNHMHWVDMQWLWGYDALPSSARDMLRLMEETGARGNLNFDAVGYEKLAAEAPDVLDLLREAVRAGRVEIVGASYAQPYGLFHGGESNIRQRVLGVRAVLRLFGVRPRAFWEEEFDFFPQLPQILAGCGFTGASLFFQWTWATPSVPEEPHALILWEGLDGTRLPALPKNELCLHQWPEDFEGRLESPLLEGLERAAIVQWLELMPSPDWMCRSEILLPRLAELFGDPRFELRPATLSELIEALGDGAEAPLRRYTLDDVFHGVSLGKNGDYMPRYSKTCEEQLLAAEGISALAGLFGRPYASWDVYPTWELDESWRELCIAQHHDNHECEGLCGAIGERSFERSLGLSGEVFARTLEHLAKRVDALEGSSLVYNPLGWTRDVAHEDGVVRGVPAYGYKVIDPYEIEEPRLGRVDMEISEEEVSLSRGELHVTIDRARGVVTQIRSRHFPEGLLHAARPLGDVEMVRGGTPERFETASFASDTAEEGEYAEFAFLREGRAGSKVRVTYSLSTLHEALWIKIQGQDLARPDGGMHAGLQTAVEPELRALSLVHDHPYGVTPVRAERDYVRKYPTGDWMTSPQVFEEVRRPFTAASLVDLLEADEGSDPASAARGLLVVHDGSQALFRVGHGVRFLLDMYDPWDGEHFDNVFEAELWVLPHGPLSNTERMRIAMECNAGSPRYTDSAVVQGGGDLPPAFGGLQVDCPNVLATAFFREGRRDAERLPRRFGPDVRDPYVVRLVELDGRPADVTLRVPGAVALAARTNLMGEVLEPLQPRAAPAPFGPSELPWSALRLAMRPHEVATILLDLELGRAVPRDLDSHRQVWASAHRQAGRRA